MILRCCGFLLFILLFNGMLCCAVAAPRVLFDESHAQQFLTSNQGALDLSGLATLLRDQGLVVKSTREPLTTDLLADADVLVISGPFKPLDEKELQAVLNYLEAGGGLAVMLHIAPPIGALLYRLDVDFTNGSLRETAQLIGGNPLNFKVSKLAAHPVTDGLTDFSVYGCWALRATAPHVSILAETSERGWVDLDRNNQLSRSDAVQRFGVIAAGELGKGRYVIVGDDALFQNQFLDESNQKLAINIANWLSFK